MLEPFPIVGLTLWVILTVGAFETLVAYHRFEFLRVVTHRFSYVSVTCDLEGVCLPIVLHKLFDLFVDHRFSQVVFFAEGAVSLTSIFLIIHFTETLSAGCLSTTEQDEWFTDLLVEDVLAK